MVQIAVPGERWEVEYFSDRPVEVEVFRGDGEVKGPEAVEAPVLDTRKLTPKVRRSPEGSARLIADVRRS